MKNKKKLHRYISSMLERLSLLISVNINMIRFHPSKRSVARASWKCTMTCSAATKTCQINSISSTLWYCETSWFVITFHIAFYFFFSSPLKIATDDESNKQSTANAKSDLYWCIGMSAGMKWARTMPLLFIFFWLTDLLTHLMRFGSELSFFSTKEASLWTV